MRVPNATNTNNATPIITMNLPHFTVQPASASVILLVGGSRARRSNGIANRHQDDRGLGEGRNLRPPPSEGARQKSGGRPLVRRKIHPPSGARGGGALGRGVLDVEERELSKVRRPAASWGRGTSRSQCPEEMDDELQHRRSRPRRASPAPARARPPRSGGPASGGISVVFVASIVRQCEAFPIPASANLEMFGVQFPVCGDLRLIIWREQNRFAPAGLGFWLNSSNGTVKIRWSSKTSYANAQKRPRHQTGYLVTHKMDGCSRS